MKSILVAASLVLASSAWAAGPITPTNASGTGTYSVDGPDPGILSNGYAAPELTLYTITSVSWSGQEGSAGATFTLASASSTR